jgi:murein DD-endopeptidase MepM/ murein hydrolase activator NlpD
MSCKAKFVIIPGFFNAENPQAMGQVLKTGDLGFRHAEAMFWPALSSVLVAMSVAMLWGSLGDWPSGRALAQSRAAAVATPLPASIDTERAYLSALHTGMASVRVVTTRLRRGEALQALIERSGSLASDAAMAAASLQSVFDGRLLHAGQSVQMWLDQDQEGAIRLVGLALSPEPARALYVRRSGEAGFRVIDQQATLISVARHVTGKIEGSLYLSALAEGASPAAIADMTRLLSYSIDFQREIYSGDQFELFYTEFQNLAGEPVKTGDLHFVALQSGDRQLEYWRHLHDDGETLGFYDKDAEAAAKLLMKTPVDGARLSSNFGKRRHPILGYARMHKGIDFAAPTGTPIYAAGHGVVEKAERWSSFGNYIRIRHANGYKTAYAHLHRIGKGIKPGVKVRQGQIIGEVGSTGRSTGPHLHYEVHKNDVAINPMTIPDLGGERLVGPERARFQVHRAMINAARAKSQSIGEGGEFSAL